VLCSEALLELRSVKKASNAMFLWLCYNLQQCKPFDGILFNDVNLKGLGV
jgi:hypothetical protein